MKKKVKRYAGQDKSLVEIEERSIKTPRLIEEEKAKAPMDYAGLGGRARATSMMSGPVLDIKEEKTETESEAPRSEASKGIAAGFDAKRYLEESESKGGGPRSETKPTVAKKAAPKKVEPVSKTEKSKSLVFKDSEPRYESDGAKIGSQGNFKFDSTPKKAPVTRYRKQEEPAAEVKVPKSKMDYEPEAPKLSKDDSRYKTKYGEFSFQKGFKKEEGAPEKRTRSAADIRAGRYKSGGKVSSASSRADGIAQRGKTKGRIC